MEGGVKQPDGTEWPVIDDQERTLYELLFYSQGPVDGYLLGEGVRDLFLKSGLSLRVLSQIWNLADVSNDNVLNVHEFSLVMHLIRGLQKGLKAPPTLPRKLTPPKTAPVALPAMTAREREAYTGIFRILDVPGHGVLDGDCCRHIFEASELTSEELAQVWNLSDVTRDGKLDVEEFCVACHLLRFLKAGHSLSGPVDVFKELPDKVDPQSLRARKRRVEQYEQHKQKLMSLKEKRRQQVTQENKRLQLQQEKLDLLRQVYKEQKKRGQLQISEEQFSNGVATQKEEIEKLEEIVFRLKKEHEKVRQETVKIILAEQKLNTDIVTIKKDTDELNKRLGTCHTHATKDPDPFHQLYEQRKEKRQGSTIKDLDKIDVSLPFTFNPFDPGLPSTTLSQGVQLFAGKGNNHGGKGNDWQGVMDRLAGFGEGFEAVLASSASSPDGSEGNGEEDPVFKEIPVSMGSERWLGFCWGPEDEDGVLGLSGPGTEELQEKLLNLRAELRKLNQPGTRLLFKNPDDYLARKRAKEEEEKEKDRSRFQRRSVTDRRSVSGPSEPGVRSRVSTELSGSPRLRDRGPRDRFSYTERNEHASQAVREYRQKRQSLQSLDSSLPASTNSSASSSPREVRRTPADPHRPSTSTASLTSDLGLGSLTKEEDPSPQRVREKLEGTSTLHVEVTETRSAPALQPPREERGFRGSEDQVQSVRHSRDSDKAAGKPGSNVSASSAGRVFEESVPKRDAEFVDQLQKVREQPPKPAEVEQNPQSSLVVEKQQVTSLETQTKRAGLVERQSTEATVISVISETASVEQRNQQPISDQEPTDSVPSSTDSVQKASDPVQRTTDPFQISADPAQRSSDHAQRAISPEGGPGIRQTRSSSKKTRAPPPPQAGSAGITSASSSTTVVVSVTATGKGPGLPSAAVAVERKPSPSHIDQSKPVTVQSQPLPAQPPSPERPARPKRRKGSSSISGSNPTSPQEALGQPSFQEDAVSGKAQANPVSDLFQLTENSCLEEEAPPAQGTVIVPSKSRPKEKSASKAASPQSAVPPLALNGDGQTAASHNGAASDPVKQKRRKGKAPEPPTSSANSSPRDAPVSPSSTPSPSASPRDPPFLSRPAEDANSVVNKSQESKTERRKSTKAKAPPPPQQTRSNPAPKTIQEPNTDLQVAQESRSNAKPSKVSSRVETTVPPSPTPAKSPESVGKNVQAREPEIATNVERQEQDGSRRGRSTNHEVVIAKDLVAVPESDRGRVSETSSIGDSDADSLPPPLPSSAPPPLPSIPPPSPLPVQDEEVIEVTTITTTHTLPAGQVRDRTEEGVMTEFDCMLPDTLPDTVQDPQKAMASLRAQFFGLNSSGKENGPEVRETNEEEEEDQSGDSDLSSDERGAEGAFSLGDSGVVLSSLPTSPDDNDSRIQLLSYTTTATDNHPQSLPHASASAQSVSSQRPQSLPVSESATSEDTVSPTSSGQLMSVQDMAALSPRSREIFEKAQRFAEMVQKPNWVAKRDRPGGEEGEDDQEDELGQQDLQDLEMERRAVISQATVRRREVRGHGPAMEKDELDEGGVDRSGKLEDARWQEIGDPVPPAEQSGIPDTQDLVISEEGTSAEARWQDRTTTVTLYSQNVLQESDSSEVVDRESIANLASTRRQWEAIFTSEPKDDPASKPKKNPPKWQVRMPYAEKTSAGPATVSANIPTEEPESPPPVTHSSSMADTESAIEREIRLAVEREQMLRQEQEERLRQQTPRGGKVSSMESSTESELHPTFHELAEADRGSEFFINERVQQQEDAEQEESLQRGYAHQKLSAVPKSDVSATESIIEREIRLQREREAELALQRGGRKAVATADLPVQKQSPVTQLDITEEEDDEMDVVIQEIPYEDAISFYNHEGESRIAQELRELKEREEEVRLLRERMNKTAISGGESPQQKPAAPSSSPAVRPASKPPSAPQTPRGDRSMPNTPRVDKSLTPTIGFSHSIQASPRTDTPSSKTATPKPETPIEREIRLARERENELRRAKGLPELHPEPKKQESLEETQREEMVMTPRHAVSQPDSTMRRFASNRLQQEILDQRNREMKLRQEGKIITTSEEHIQPLKYTEVVGQDQTDGVGKRNFRTPARRNSNTSQDSATSGESTPRSQPAPQTPRDGAGGLKTAGTRAVSFSYREFAQTAESKIERELREMREREEELRKQRRGGAES